MTTLLPEILSDMRRSLDEAGYFVLRDVVRGEQLAELNAKVLDAFARSDKFQGGGSISGHLNCFPGEAARFVYDAIETYGIVEAIRVLRAGRSNEVRATLNFNLPGSKAQHYHMDGTFVGEFLICNIAVIDTDRENGAIDLLPGTHRQFYPFWRYAVGRKHRLTTRITMNQGDVLLRKSTLWHRGMPNRTGVPRPMMAITFGEGPTPTGDPFGQLDGQIVFYPNWFPSTRLGALRERIEVALPITRSTYRFVTSLMSNRGYSSY